MADTGQTIIIKKIKKGGHGHHGGAWKVAYADFVTAMMAFFLLMWLLNATEAVTLSGLADYFAPTIGVKDNMGIGFRGGKSALSKGMGADKNTNKGVIYGGTPAGPIVKVTERIEDDTEEPDDEKIAITLGMTGTTEFQGTEKEVKPSDTKGEQAAAPPAPTMAEVAQQLQNIVNEMSKDGNSEQKVNTVETPEGLEIQIHDMREESMFMTGTADFQPRVVEALTQLSAVLSRLPNYLSVTGHTSSVPVRGKKGYSNWELSADRANAARKLMIQSGVQPEQVVRVIGKSDNEPLDPKHPAAAVNNRISIMLLRNASLPEHKLGAPSGVFIDPRSSDAQDITDEDEDGAPKPKAKPEASDTILKEDSNIKQDIKTLNNRTDEEAIKKATQEGPETINTDALRRQDAAEAALKAKEEKPTAPEEATKTVNKQLIEENKTERKAAEEFEQTPVQDPIAGGNAIDPLKAVKEDKPKAEEPKLKAVNRQLIEENKAERKAAEEFEQTPVQDPLSGGTAIDPLKAVKEDKPKAAESSLKAVNQKLLEDDQPGLPVDDATSQDPFASGNAVDPFAAADEAAKKEQGNVKKAAPAAPVNSYLLAPDKDEDKTETFQGLPAQDPFSGGGFNPLEQAPQ